MIISFFKSGTSGARSAINYVLGVLDHEKNERSVKPKVIDGSIEAFQTSVEFNPNKWKYTSGVIAFRDNENPSNEEKKQIIKNFKATYFAGMPEDSIPCAFIEHRDKGNLEIHFLASRMTTNFKSFNMNPPGQKAFELTKSFQSLVNHKFGYDQVIENPLKVHLTKFEKIFPDESKAKIKESLAEKLSIGIQKGKIKNRNELISTLEQVGGKITRVGQDYLSVKFPKMEKSIRLKGPFFSKNADYLKILLDAKNQQLKLSDDDFSKVEKKLASLIHERQSFNEDRHKPRVLKARLYQLKNQQAKEQSTEQTPTTKQTDQPLDTGAAPSRTPQAKQFEVPTEIRANIQAVMQAKQEKKSTDRLTSSAAQGGANGDGGPESLEAQIASLDGQARAINSKLNTSKSPQEQSSLRMRLATLMAKKFALETKIRADKDKNKSKPTSRY